MRAEPRAEEQLEIAIHGCAEFERIVSMELLNFPFGTIKARLSFLFLLMARDHFKAIIHLLDDGEHRQGAFALVRPVADASFRAIWIAHFATESEIEIASANPQSKYPSPKKIMVMMHEKFKWSGDELDDVFRDDWEMLCGYVHTGHKQLKNRANIKDRFPHGEALTMLMRAATYLWLGTCFVASGSQNAQTALRIDAANTKLFELVGATDVPIIAGRPWVN